MTIKTASERFRSKVKINSESGCWEWQGGVTGSGYGYFWHKGRMQRAHRVVFMLNGYQLDDSKCLDHLCRNRRCVNPQHLEEVSFTENILRGESLFAKNAAKTHCHRGHEFTEANTYRYRGGKSRMCLRCRDLRRQKAEASSATV